MKIGKKLRSLRKSSKITLKELSRKSGIQIATLSRMENDIMTGTLKSHISMCKVFGVSLSDLYKELEEEHKTLSLRKDPKSYVQTRKHSTQILTSKPMDKKMMPLLIRIGKNGKTPEEKNKVGTEKFLYVVDGKISISISQENYSLSKADSVYFDASFPHKFENKGKSEAHVLCIVTPPSS